ncbi:MAG: histidinol dehydrogenase [Sediminibacterium sp.]|nr:histidinol dehydrogenase [Sediminibacterium sp.]
MLVTIAHPAPSEWEAILQRPVVDATVLFDRVRTIMQEVKQEGDAAIRKHTLALDGVALDAFAITPETIQAAKGDVSKALQDAIATAAQNIRRFHSTQLKEESPVETMAGVTCWRKMLPIEKVGLYIPGGTAPLFSTILMLGIPAQLAGCKEIILCTPPGKDGKIHPAMLVAAAEVGIQQIFTVGGVQAIAAMTYGTETIPAVYKIFGPGNQYVTAAKQLAQLAGIAIDMPAGPSEVCVLADATANPAWVAADLLSQAEHGADSQVLLVTTDASVPEKVRQALEQQLQQLPRNEMARKALANSRAIVVDTTTEALALVNAYAPEHLIIACAAPELLAAGIVNAGSVFLGQYTPESVGDYASGTNHTLPTNGFARAYSGVSVDSFVKKVTFQQLSKDGLAALAPVVMEMAMAEGLAGHARAVSIRLEHS